MFYSNDVGNSREVYNEFNKSHEQFLNILPLTKLATSQSSNNELVFLYGHIINYSSLRFN